MVSQGDCRYALSNGLCDIALWNVILLRFPRTSCLFCKKALMDNSFALNLGMYKTGYIRVVFTTCVPRTSTRWLSKIAPCPSIWSTVFEAVLTCGAFLTTSKSIKSSLVFVKCWEAPESSIQAFWLFASCLHFLHLAQFYSSYLQAFVICYYLLLSLIAPRSFQQRCSIQCTVE